MRPITFTLNLDNTSTTNVAAAQTLAGAGNMVLAAGAAAIDSSGAARNVLFTTTEDDSAVHYTITGKDADGNSLTEGPTTLPNSTTKASTKAFASISVIAIDAAIGANMSVGTTNATATGLSKTIPLNFYARTGSTIAVKHTGTIVYTMQETFDDVLGSGTNGAIWYNGSLSNDTQNTSGAGTVGANLVSVSSADSRSQLDKGSTGCRVSIASYTNGATLTIRIISESNSDRG